VRRPVGPADQNMRRSIVLVPAENQKTPPGEWVKRISDREFDRRTPGTMSPLPMTAAGVRRRSTPSSPPPSSTTSIRRLGSPTCWPACRIIPQGASTNSCLGTGAFRASLTPPERNRLSAQSDLTRGRRRMRTADLAPAWVASLAGCMLTTYLAVSE
jgi:hypothetical protein